MKLIKIKDKYYLKDAKSQHTAQSVQVKDIGWEEIRQLKCEIVVDSGEKLTIDEAKEKYGVDCNVYQCQNKATPILLANNVNETKNIALDKNPAKGYVFLGKARKIMADPKKRYPYYFYD